MLRVAALLPTCESRFSLSIDVGVLEFLLPRTDSPPSLTDWWLVVTVPNTLRKAVQNAAQLQCINGMNGPTQTLFSVGCIDLPYPIL